MIERIHLKIIQALAKNGTLTAAAHALCLTQPALSHQIRYLEKKLGVALWQREGRQLRLTRAGECLLAIADQILPVFDQAENMLQAYADGRQGVMRIGVECHPCYAWLKSILSEFLRQLPDVDMDIINQFQFSGLEGLLNHHVDVLVTPDKVSKPAIRYIPLFDYELVLMVAASHPLAAKQVVEAEALENEIILTFPVTQERLDLFTRFLRPASVSPKTKTMSSMDMMVQMVNLNRGVTVLPDWLAASYCQQMPLRVIKLGIQGIMKTLFAAVRERDLEISYIKTFLQLAQSRGVNMSFTPLQIPDTGSRE